MSDWNAVHSVLPTLNSGLDLEMPGGEFLKPDTVISLVRSGKVSVETIDDKVRRILRVMFRLNLFNDRTKNGEFNTPAHRELAFEAAVKGIVLLKNNNNLLPFHNSTKSIAVIGPNAAIARTGAGGSARVNPFYSVSPLEGLKNKMNNDIEINYAPGIYMDNKGVVVSKEYLLTPDGKSRGLEGTYFNGIEIGKTGWVREQIP
ncbi:MAG: hypothetical protein HC906_08105 [Bacteroidales bacterium]|nr:hypothetical protein [Bacteroidales bacterium]